MYKGVICPNQKRMILSSWYHLFLTITMTWKFRIVNEYTATVYNSPSKWQRKLDCLFFFVFVFYISTLLNMSATQYHILTIYHISICDHMYSIMYENHAYPRPIVYTWLGNIIANARRSYICKVLFHWLRHCAPISRNWQKPMLTLGRNRLID